MLFKLLASIKLSTMIKKIILQEFWMWLPIDKVYLQDAESLVLFLELASQKIFLMFCIDFGCNEIFPLYQKEKPKSG